MECNACRLQPTPEAAVNRRWEFANTADEPGAQRFSVIRQPAKRSYASSWRIMPNLTRLPIVATLCALTSCQGYMPSAPEEEFELPGNYRAISECVLPLLDNGTAKMTPLETEKTVRFALQPNGMRIDHIDVSANGEDRTKVELYLTPGTPTGRSTSVDAVRTLFNDCSQQINAILPLSKDPG